MFHDNSERPKMLIQTKKYIILISWLHIIVIAISLLFGAILWYMVITFFNLKIRLPVFFIFIIYYFTMLIGVGIALYVKTIRKEIVNKYIKNNQKKYLLFIGEIKENFFHVGCFIITTQKIVFIKTTKKSYIIHYSDILKMVIKDYFFLWLKIKLLTSFREYIFVIPKSKSIISFFQYHLQRRSKWKI